MINIRLAARTLIRSPLVSGIAIASLALGIGANAAIFSMTEQMLLSKLPVRAPDELVALKAPGPQSGSNSCNQAGECDEVFSYQMFRDLEREQTVLTGLVAHRAFGGNIALRGQTPISGEGMMVSGSYFPTLGLNPALGRLLGPDDDQTIGAHPLAVLSYGYWSTQLGSDPAVLNQPIMVNGTDFTVVGVAPRGFHGTTLGSQPDVYVPLTMEGLLKQGTGRFENRRSFWIYLFGRLKPEVSVAQATTGLNTVYTRIINEVEAPLQKGMSDQTLQRFKEKSLVLTVSPQGQSSIDEEARIPLTLLLAVTGFVLLIACANIANLLLARAAGRSTEMAVRLSLGASRTRLVAQLLTESILLAIVGGLVGLLVARGTLLLMLAMFPAGVNEVLRAEIKPSVLLYTAILSLATGIVFGLFPALQSTRKDLITSIRSGAMHALGARAAMRFRSALVVTQLALSMALLVSAGLFVKSLVNVSKVDLGVQTDNVVTFAVSPELNGYSNQRNQILFNELRDALASEPGVTSVAMGLVPLMSGSNWGNSVYVQGFEADADTDRNSRYNEISAGYFSSLGVALRSGREFTEADALGAPQVAIVNETFTKKFGLGQNAVGAYISRGSRDTLNIQIVGVIPDVKYSEVKAEIPPVFYLPLKQDSTVGSLYFYVTTSLEPTALLRGVPGIVKGVDPTLPVEELKTLSKQVEENVFLDRFISSTAGTFALLATLLAAIGLYGVLAYSIAQRTREIGVRMALGADAASVRGMVMKQLGRLTLIGGGLGLMGAIALGKAAQSLLYGVTGLDPAVIALAAAILGVVSLLAGLVPALRAARIPPMQALRYE